MTDLPLNLRPSNLQNGLDAVNPTTTEFGAVLRNLRTNRRISQSHLARRADLDHSYLSRLESGSRQPTVQAVERIADALKATAEETDSLRESAGFKAAHSESRTVSNVWLVRLDRALLNAPPAIRNSTQLAVEFLTLGIESRTRQMTPPEPEPTPTNQPTTGESFQGLTRAFAFLNQAKGDDE